PQTPAVRNVANISASLKTYIPPKFKKLNYFLNKTVKISTFYFNFSFKYFYTNVIVHFDLKGAPPKAGYFLRLLELTAKSGATGVLIEWEDMFPWSGELEIVRSTNAYKVSEVQGILRKARNLGLEVIPLVQTFGHMEWILKHEKFRALRENDNYPQVICIGSENSVKLVKKIISQVVNVHKPFGIKRFHIGADEAFQFGVCNKSQKLARKLGSSSQLAIEYLGTIANYVKNITNGATILAWHDMVKQFINSGEVLSKLGTLLQPVIWDYSEKLETMSKDFLAIADTFPKMWASSAFKGANTPSSKYMDYGHYQKNNLQWITTQRLLRNHSRLAFEGMIITGWSRYDHMARLCEILPIGTPSMVLNTQIALIGAHKTLGTSTMTVCSPLICH
ncbi:unnamed protein product, partial [Angiostrongylus costaricensis]|uniref:beta-N-acetylhexosaminidase n=1 Tax=Angiostrongylus costaricensis TaxID=334426 RepID=A0A158PHW9_ANGCS